MKSNFKRNELPEIQAVIDRIVLYHSLGREELESQAFTEALTNLKSAFQLAHSAGDTEHLPSIAYDFGIAAMHIIRAVPSPAAAASMVSSPKVTQINKLGKPKACASSPSLSTIPQSPTSQSPGVYEKDEPKKKSSKDAAKEPQPENNPEPVHQNKDDEGNSQPDHDHDHDALTEMKVEKKKLAFRFRSSSYSKFNEVKNRSKPELGSESSTSSGTSTPPKRPFFRAASFGSNLRIKSNFAPPPPISAVSDGSSSLPSPPLTPPLGTGQVNESGITTNDVNSAASALCYLLRLVTTEQAPETLVIKTQQPEELPAEEDKIWSGELITSDDDLVVGVPVKASQVMLKKAELCYMISQLYMWVGQSFLGDQYLKQAKENAASYRLALNLPIDTPVFPVFEGPVRPDLVVSKSSESLIGKISRKISKVAMS